MDAIDWHEKSGDIYDTERLMISKSAAYNAHFILRVPSLETLSPQKS
jgi:hypothetical protein